MVCGKRDPGNLADMTEGFPLHPKQRCEGYEVALFQLKSSTRGYRAIRSFQARPSTPEKLPNLHLVPSPSRSPWNPERPEHGFLHGLRVKGYPSVVDRRPRAFDAHLDFLGFRHEGWIEGREG
jgi:hypothetical protein